MEPWGEERADIRSGIIAATVYNIGKGKAGKTLTPADFIPKFEKRWQDPAVRDARLMAIAVMYNSKKQP